MAEVYKDKVYAPFFDGKKDLTVVDIGGNIGITSYYFSQFSKKVYCLEPSKQHFDCIKQMVEFNKLGDVIQPINKAVYTKVGKLPFGGPKTNQTMRSLHMATWDNGQPDEEVEATTLEELVKEYGIKHIDFLKLDVEGSEQEIIGHSSFKAVAPIIDTMLLEVHTWNGRNTDQLIDALENAGFTKVTRIPNDASILVAQKN